MSSKKLAFKYIYQVSIGGPPAHLIQKAQKSFNKTWGFDDGNCNYVDSNGEILSKPGADNLDFMNAAKSLYHFERLFIEVSIFKDGKRKYKIINKE